MPYTKKTFENVRQRSNINLVKNGKDYLKYTPKPSYMLRKIFDNSLVAIMKSEITFTLNKLAYTGSCILDLSKV